MSPNEPTAITMTEEDWADFKKEQADFKKDQANRAADKPTPFDVEQAWANPKAQFKVNRREIEPAVLNLDYAGLEKRAADAWEAFTGRIAANRADDKPTLADVGKDCTPYWQWKHGTYCGPLDGLAQQPARLRPDPDSPDHVLAQFDALEMVHDGEQMAFGWRRFPAKYFDVDE